MVAILVMSCLGLGFIGWLGSLGYTGVVIGLIGLTASVLIFRKGGSRFRVGSVLGAIGCVIVVLMGFGTAQEKSAREGATTAQRQREAAQKQADLEKMPELVRDLDAAIQQGQWEKASALHEKGMKVQPDNPGLAGKREIITAAMEKARTEKEEAQRKVDVADAVREASNILSNKELCDTPKAIGEVWAKLRQVRKTDPEFASAKSVTVKLEKCRSALEKSLSEGVRSIMVTQREKMAKALETNYLDNGMDVRVSLRGTYKDHIVLSWALMSRVTVHQITKDGEFSRNFEKVGFKKITFTDGYDESWYVGLNPTTEEGGGKKVLEDMQLDKPLSL
jgi:hypothetical protein